MQADFAAFLSYARLDDEHDAGYLSQLCERLSREVRVQTGRDFPIFQDKKSIEWGENWKRRIDESIDATTFLIPITSPNFITSDICHSELLTFLGREKRLGRDDLILPIYYVDCSLFKEDEVGKVLFERQYADWRELRFGSLDSKKCRKQIERLAVRLRDAIRRLQEIQPTTSITDLGTVYETSHEEDMALRPDISDKDPPGYQPAEDEINTLLPDASQVSESILEKVDRKPPLGETTASSRAEAPKFDVPKLKQSFKDGEKNAFPINAIKASPSEGRKTMLAEPKPVQTVGLQATLDPRFIKATEINEILEHVLLQTRKGPGGFELQPHVSSALANFRVKDICNSSTSLVIRGVSWPAPRNFGGEVSAGTRGLACRAHG